MGIQKPAPSEYAPYYGMYIERVGDGYILKTLAAQLRDTRALLGEQSEERGSYRYAPGKWSLKQVIGHLADAERVFTYRALVFARNDKTPLPSMEQDDWMTQANFDGRSLASIVAEFGAVRAATLALFESFDGEIAARRGTANGFEFTVRAMPYIVAGHEAHHVGVIRERYL